MYTWLRFYDLMFIIKQKFKYIICDHSFKSRNILKHVKVIEMIGSLDDRSVGSTLTLSKLSSWQFVLIVFYILACVWIGFIYNKHEDNLHKDNVIQLPNRGI